MNVNAVGPSDEHDVHKAAIEAQMLDKEPSAQERAVEAQRIIVDRYSRWLVLPDGVISWEALEALFAQIKSQADRIAELEKDANRLDWIMPVLALMNTTDEIMNDRTLAIVAQLMKSLSGREAIDAAMNERKE